MNLDKPFEVVGDLKENTSSISDDCIAEFSHLALNDGYSSDIVERAKKYITPNMTDYKQFESIAIEKALKDIDEEQHYAEQKRARIERSAQLALEKVVSVRNPNIYLESLIAQKYNTTAVTSMDLIEQSKDSVELRLDLYRKPVYSLIIQIDLPWVRDKVDECLSLWKTDKYVRNYIGRYMHEKQIKDTNLLIQLLPVVIQNESSPSEYKLFKAVQLARQQSDNEEVVEMDAVSDESFLCYNDTIESAFKGNTPFLMSEIVATEEAIRSMPSAERKSLFVNASTVYGKAIRLKYQTAKNFDDAMRSSLGEYYEPWKASKEARIAERAEKKRLRREEAQRRKSAPAVPKVSVDKNEHESSKSKEVLGNHSEGSKQKEREPVNIGPDYKDIPFPFVITAVHILLALILWLILGKVKAVFLAVCFVVASAGFFLLKKEKLKASLAIALSYVFTFIIIIL